MNVLAVLQARMASSRLPGKVLRSIMGRPMLARQLDRVHRSRLIERLVVAISDDPSDDPLAEFLVSEGIGLYRGSLDDVLDRVYRAAAAHDPGNVVRLTGDCPLADPDLIDRVIEEHLAGGFDYSSNCLEPTWPDGLDTEVMRFNTLDQARKRATLASEREHVTPFIHNRPELFHLHSIKAGTDLSRHRWTVDARRAKSTRAVAVMASNQVGGVARPALAASTVSTASCSSSCSAKAPSMRMRSRTSRRWGEV